ncbi:hypothetical protein B0H13DRAFT_1926689 [Mycena leptocephala]|nr:hypothetical protein B0H13DRAFT_1926689 [Mycena leptocephala]
MALSLLPQRHFHLKSLFWAYEDSSLLSYMPILLGPTVTQLRLILTPAHLTISHLSLIPSIAKTCPQLTGLEISLLRDDDASEEEAACISTSTIQRSVSLLVQGLTHIERLRVANLDHSAFEHLAALPTLQFLDVEALHSFPPLQPPSFSGLHHLDICPRTVASAIPLISSLSKSPIASITIAIPTVQELAEIFSLYHSVSGSLPHETLQDLSITYEDRTPIASPENGFDRSEMLKQFFPFHNLTGVLLDIPGGFCMDDALAQTLARSWPKLESLQIVPRFPTPATSRVTLYGLRAFADHCPSLVELWIELTALSVPKFGRDTGHQAKLQRLQVGYAPIEDASAVARFIFGIFPLLSCIDPDQADEETVEQWKLVERKLTEKRNTCE